MKEKFSNLSSDKKKKLWTIVITLVCLFTVLGTTYALWNKTITTGENKIKTGQVVMSFAEKNEMNLVNAMPMSDANGKIQTNYFDFSVSNYVETSSSDTTG